MLAVPSHLYYVKYPPGFEEDLARSEDAEQFNTDAFLLRVDKNCYVAADAGRMWYDTLTGFLQEALGFKTPQIDRCVFVRHKHTADKRSTCVILVYVGDLLVLGSTSTVAEISAGLRDRFPLTDGASDYLGTEFEISDNVVHVHQEAYVAKVVTEAGFGGCWPVAAPLTMGYTAVDFDAPAGADSNAASTIDFPHVAERTALLPGDTHDAVAAKRVWHLLVNIATVGHHSGRTDTRTPRRSSAYDALNQRRRTPGTLAHAIERGFHPHRLLRRLARPRECGWKAAARRRRNSTPAPPRR